MTGIVRNNNRSGPMISVTRTQEKEKAKEDDNTSDGKMISGTVWQRMAKDRKLWKEMQEAYVERYTEANKMATDFET